MEGNVESYYNRASKLGINDGFCCLFTLKGHKQILSMSPPPGVHVTLFIKCGIVEMIYNGGSRKVSENDVYDIFVGSLTIFRSATEDAEMVVLMLPRDGFRKVFAENFYPIPHYYFIKSFTGPVVTGDAAFSARFSSHLHQLGILMGMNETSEIRDIKNAILKYIILDLCDLSIRSRGVKRRAVSESQTELTIAFRHLFYKQECPNRNISWYVERLGVSPQYFSSAIKNVTGFSPTEVIDLVVLRSICIRIYNGQDINQIVEDFDFSGVDSLDAFLVNRVGSTSSQLKENVGRQS